MANIQTLLISKVSKYLPWIETFFLAVLLIGALLAFAGFDAKDIIFFALSGLSIVYFLKAFRTPEEEEEPDASDEQRGLGDLLVSHIIPKVLWISSSVATLGILFYILDPGNQGYKEMLMIGGSTIMVGLVLLGFLFIGGTKHLKIVQPVLVRAVPIGLLAAYIFVK